MTQSPERAVLATANCVPMSDVLSRVGHELRQLARLLARIEAEMAPLILEAAGQDPAMLHRIQSFDHIQQKTAGLADFIAALVPQTNQCLVHPAEAAEVVTLADLAARLGFRDEQGRACATALDDDFEMF